MDRYNPGLLQERQVRLRLFLKYILLSVPNSNILEYFLQSSSFASIPVQSDCRPEIGPSIISQEEIVELEMTVKQYMRVISEIHQRLTVLRRYLITFSAFESAYSKSQQKLTEATKAFMQARRKPVRSQYSESIVSANNHSLLRNARYAHSMNLSFLKLNITSDLPLPWTNFK